mmetsp:Transcript_72476/g.200939  ORF Transcript_72476/g.200939 Transcript_72476/m.200939 type:complete len:482 (-) Transcript_72476:1051-2496(-)
MHLRGLGCELRALARGPAVLLAREPDRCRLHALGQQLRGGAPGQPDALGRCDRGQRSQEDAAVRLRAARSRLPARYVQRAAKGRWPRGQGAGAGPCQRRGARLEEYREGARPEWRAAAGLAEPLRPLRARQLAAGVLHDGELAAEPGKHAGCRQPLLARRALPCREPAEEVHGHLGHARSQDGPRLEPAAPSAHSPGAPRGDRLPHQRPAGRASRRGGHLPAVVLDARRRAARVEGRECSRGPGRAGLLRLARADAKPGAGQADGAGVGLEKPGLQRRVPRRSPMPAAQARGRRGLQRHVDDRAMGGHGAADVQGGAELRAAREAARLVERRHPDGRLLPCLPGRGSGAGGRDLGHRAPHVPRGLLGRARLGGVALDRSRHQGLRPHVAPHPLVPDTCSRNIERRVHVHGRTARAGGLLRHGWEGALPVQGLRERCPRREWHGRRQGHCDSAVRLRSRGSHALRSGDGAEDGVKCQDPDVQ